MARVRYLGFPIAGGPGEELTFLDGSAPKAPILLNCMSSPDLSKLPRIQGNQVPVSNPNAVESVYANFIGAGATQSDIRLIFTELGTSFDGKDTPVNVLKANVVI